MLTTVMMMITTTTTIMMTMESMPITHSERRSISMFSLEQCIACKPYFLGPHGTSIPTQSYDFHHHHHHHHHYYYTVADDSGDTGMLTTATTPTMIMMTMMIMMTTMTTAMMVIPVVLLIIDIKSLSTLVFTHDQCTAREPHLRCPYGNEIPSVFLTQYGDMVGDSKHH